MTNLHNNKQPNLVSFLRDNRPLPPHPHPDLEQKIIDSLEPRNNQNQKNESPSTWTIPSATGRNPRFAIARSRSAKLLATGFLFTSVSFSFKTPRVAVEPQELDNFLVKNWQDTIENHDYTLVDETEANWLFTNTQKAQKSQPALSVSTP
ncbi:MAG: hypothetical protein ACRC80_34400 [Waterburya sp.]